MKIVLFGPERRIGAWQNDKIIDLNHALANYLRDQRRETNAQARADEKIPPQLERFIALGKAAVEDAERAIEHATKQGLEAVVHDVKSVKLHAPWPERRIACVGGNYAAHLAGMWAGRPGVTGDLAQITQLAKEEGQWGFWKNPHEVAGPDDEIPYPKRTRRFDYEGEVAIVLGKRGKDIPAARINGEVRQHYNTKEMIWSFGEVLEYLSRDFSFVPGDVIAGGTSAGTAAEMSRRKTESAQSPNLFLKVGDVVELSSPRIGVLGNRIVAA